jgi:hypothetical protein
MNNPGNFADKWSRMFHDQRDEVIPEADEELPIEPAAPMGDKEQIKQNLKKVWKIAYHLRKIILAIPVVFWALRLAAYNSANLPAQVGIDLQASGEFARMISRQTAVMGPLAITGGCLVLMFLSRKSIYPWIISIFSLVLPLLLLLTNLYPA